MLVYRIVHKDFSKTLYASGLEGRWNGPDKKVIYTAESIALAFLENMVRRQGVGFNDDFKSMIIEVPSDLKIAVVNADNLEEGWRNFRNYSTCQVVGNNWYDERKFPVLKVPSAVLPEGSNYVINAMHKDFKRVKLIETTDLIPDERIEEILKKYRKKNCKFTSPRTTHPNV